MNIKLCNVCGGELKHPAYESQSATSISSLGAVLKGSTSVYFCDNCTHIQTTELANISDYYDRNYMLLVESEDQDQIYSIRDGEKIFRYDHQVSSLLKLVDIPRGARVLDYGCAKATTLNKLAQRRTDITPHVFDVSDVYVSFWRKFVDEENWASHAVNNAWEGTMDLVTSFFSLEHVASPRQMLTTVWDLLKADGMFYCIVPDVMQNAADFIVVDHVNHFTRSSVSRLFADCGFEIQEINSEEHASAMVVVARKLTECSAVADFSATDHERSAVSAKVVEMSDYWAVLGSRIRTFESSLQAPAQAAIYGSGFYGAYIASCLTDLEKIKFFLDRDPYRHGKLLFGKTIIDPESMPDSIDTVLVGLNPANARQNIEMITSWCAREIQFFYL